MQEAQLYTLVYRDDVTYSGQLIGDRFFLRVALDWSKPEQDRVKHWCFVGLHWFQNVQNMCSTL